MAHPSRANYGLNGFASLRTRPLVVPDLPPKPEPRKCLKCGHTLSEYNLDDLCFCCQDKTEEPSKSLHYRALSKKEKDLIDHLYAAGHSQYAIARLVNRGRTTVQWYLEHRGSRVTPLSEQTKDAIERMCAEGASWREMADVLDLTLAAVRRAAKERGLTWGRKSCPV